jgi:single-stranded-DNA-specific exonuclease
LVVTEGEDSFDGSMRSVATEDLRKMINESGLATCTGHENSSGITIPKENLNALIEYLNKVLADYHFSSDTVVDVQIDRCQITNMLLESIENFNRITGNGFGEIKVLIDGVRDYNIKEMSGGKHLCVELPDIKFLKWNLNDWSNVLYNSELSAIGTLSVNNFMGKKTVQMIMEDYQFSIPQESNNLFF